MLHPRAIIFDMDGLMIDSEPLWWRVEKELATANGLVWTDDMAATCVGKGLPNVIEVMRAELGLTLDVQAGVDWLLQAFARRLDDLELKPGCAELIGAARSVDMPIAVASSSPAHLVTAVLKRFDLTDHFETTMSGDAVEHAKPAPDIFVKTLAKLAIEADQCVILEDSLAGVRAARAANAPVIAVPEQDADRFHALTDYVVEDLYAARELIAL